MKNLTSYPADTATGACLVTRKSKVKPGDTIIDLQVDLESLPAFGRLCIHENGVRLLVTQLKWKLVDPAEAELVDELRTANAELRAELAATRDSLRTVFAAAKSVGVDMPAPEGVDS